MMIVKTNQKDDRGNIIYHEIEMKSRSSMGQKVLASIVIRLALTESFSSQCNIIALDEPTTNLDRKHVEQLAIQIKKLLEIKKKSNFQMILITHDNEFLQLIKEQIMEECLNNVDGNYNYYRIYKEKNFSKIDTIPIQDL